MSTHFDPNAMATEDSGIFGLPSTAQDSLIHILPVPWEVTTSYGAGTSQGPEAVLEASAQIDLFDLDFGKAYERGFFMQPISDQWIAKNKKLKALANERLELMENGKMGGEEASIAKEINAASEELNLWVYSFAQETLKSGKIPAVLGGDHSSPYGLIKAAAEQYPDELGVLHIDAHADLRRAYQGYQYSHASIMRNVCETTPIKMLAQIGVRDFCEEEFDYIKENSKKIMTHFDSQLQTRLFKGENWHSICNEIVSQLPKKVYISFDIDGLDPALCPNTGTPVPGGLSFHQANYLFSMVVSSGRQIVAFDLNEVAPGTDEWNANVGARVLYKLCGWTTKSMK